MGIDLSTAHSLRNLCNARPQPSNTFPAYQLNHSDSSLPFQSGPRPRLSHTHTVKDIKMLVLCTPSTQGFSCLCGHVALDDEVSITQSLPVLLLLPVMVITNLSIASRDSS